MDSAKFSSSVTESFDVSDISCTERTSRVDLKHIKDAANTLLGKGVAFAWSWKFAVHGLRLKPSDSVKFKARSMTAEEFQEIIRSKANHCTAAQIADKAGKGLGKESDKRSVTATRLVRAFAADISAFIKKGAVVPDELKTIADEAELPVEYAFLDAAYGLDDDTFAEQAVHMYTFASLFDAQIAEAHAAGYVTGSSKHSHAAAFKSYAKWRGFSLEDEPAAAAVVEVAKPIVLPKKKANPAPK